MAKTLDDIFNDDDFGLLNTNDRISHAVTENDRLMAAFEEINLFYEKHGREPSQTSMSEYNLLAKLKAFRQDESKKKLLKSFDRFDLLGEVMRETKTLDDVLNDDDFGLLHPQGDKSIFEFRHTPKPNERAESDFVAQRQPLSEDEFQKYEQVFQNIHEDIKIGKRKIQNFYNIEKNLHIGNFYILDGVFLYLESANLETEIRTLNSGSRVRTDGRTVTIFENGTVSNMLFRSLGKSIQKSGKLITQNSETDSLGLFNNANNITNEDFKEGWIYVLKSKSTHHLLSQMEDLYKIGFSSIDVQKRVKNASKETTYLFADVEVIATYRCYNLNIHRLENLIHRFFSAACVDVKITNESTKIFSPREWFIVPLAQIDRAIELLISGKITNYKYNTIDQSITHI